MKILALEFSSAQRSVAVVHPGGESGGFAVSEALDATGRESSTLGLVDDALRGAKMEREEIECIAVGRGPGSYAGIRTAIAMAQGWQLARPVKILGISSVECLAAQAQGEGWTGRVDVVIDAQRNELYLAGYAITAADRREIVPLHLAALATLQEREPAGEIRIGPEATRWFPGGRVILPRAAMLGRLALDRRDFVSGEKLEPIYLRQTAFVKAPPPRTV